ncbi:hypothetical protein [Kitasatospora sp. KL5]|uniref:hypothetical protein n=1 Tax=Kitasatospora sp. KL5 TaxID=3425125 RepID=UPI003D6F3A8F
MDIEDDLSRLLGAGADQLHVPVQTIVAEATVRGRRLRRRRRITRAVGAAAAVALITGGVAAFGPDTFNRSQAPAASTPSASLPSVLGPTDPPVNGKVATTPAGLFGVFAGLLPDSAKYDRFRSMGNRGNGPIGFTVDVDFGDGTWSTLGVDVTSDTLPPVKDCPNVPEFTVPLTMTCRVGDGGALVATYKDGNSPIDGSYRAVVQRQDNVAVEITAYSGRRLQYGQSEPEHARDTPPMTAEYWAGVAASPQFALRIPVAVARDGAARASVIQE